MNKELNIWDYPDSEEDRNLEIHTDASEEIEYDNGQSDCDQEFGEIKLQYHEEENEDAGEMKTWYRAYDTGDCTVTPWWACRQSTIIAMIDRKAELEEGTK